MIISDLSYCDEIVDLSSISGGLSEDEIKQWFTSFFGVSPQPIYLEKLNRWFTENGIGTSYQLAGVSTDKSAAAVVSHITMSS